MNEEATESSSFCLPEACRGVGEQQLLAAAGEGDAAGRLWRTTGMLLNLLFLLLLYFSYVQKVDVVGGPGAG